MDVRTGSRFLGALAVLAVVGAVVVLLQRTVPALDAALAPVAEPLRRAALPVAALVALTATAGSLWLSEGVGLVPCRLCWVQRGAMYPLVLLLPLAAVLRSRALLWAGRVLAAGGLLVAVWHVLLQRVPALAAADTCAAEVPCSSPLLVVFDVLTIPTMAACGFLLVLVLLTERTSSAADRPA